MPDADFQAASAVFSEKELADLTIAIGRMNAYNWLAIGFRVPPKAALSEQQDQIAANHALASGQRQGARPSCSIITHFEPRLIEPKSPLPENGIFRAETTEGDCVGCVGKTLPANRTRFGLFRRARSTVGGVRVQQRLISGYDKPIAGHGW